MVRFVNTFLGSLCLIRKIGFVCVFEYVYYTVCIFFRNFIKLCCGYNVQRITGVLVGAVKFLHPTMQYAWVKKQERNWIL